MCSLPCNLGKEPVGVATWDFPSVVVFTPVNGTIFIKHFRLLDFLIQFSILTVRVADFKFTSITSKTSLPRSEEL